MAAVQEKKMTLTGLTTLVAVNMMGSGIIMLPTNLAKTGAISLLSWVVTAVGSMAIAYCFAQLGVLCPRPGGMSAYSEEAHGRSSFFMASFLYYLSLAIGNVAIAISAVGYLTPFIPWLGTGAVPLFVGVVALIWLTTVANFGGANLTGRIGIITVWGVIIPVAGLSLIGWLWFDSSTFAAAWNPHNTPTGDAILSSIPLTLWAFLGMESAAQNAGAVENPQKTVPMACLLGTLGAAVIYVLSTTVIQGIVPNAELAESSAPFATVYAQMFNPFIGKVIMLLAVLACLGSLLGWQFTLSQTSKYTADERMFPSFYSRVNAAGAPVVGMVVAGVLQTLMAFSTMSPNASDQFGKLVSLAAVTNIVPYITSISALFVVMHVSKVNRSTYNLNLVAVLIAIGYSTYALYASGKDAVFGGMIVMMIAYLLYGFIAGRFAAPQVVAVPPTASRPAIATATVLLLALGLLLLPAIGRTQTLERIQSTRTLNIGFVTDQPPFSFVGDDKEPRGYAVDLCKYITASLEARLAVSRVNVTYVPTSLTAGLDMIERGELDMFCGAITQTREAREHVSFSIPIYVSGIGAIVRKDAPPSLLRALNGEVPHTGPIWRATINAGLSNQTYAVYAGSTSEQQVRERVATSGVIASIVPVHTHEEGVEMVAQGKASAFFDDRVVLVSYAAGRKDSKALRVLDRRFTLEPVGIALRRGDEDFRLAVDTALSDLYRSGQYIPTYSRHFGDPSETAQMLFQAYALP
jgi:putrescine:ornithine antiporter